MQERFGVGGFGSAEVGEQVAGVAAGANSGDVVGGPQRVPEEVGGAGLAMAVTGGSVQVEGPPSVVHGRIRVAGSEVDLDQGRVRLGRDHPEAAPGGVGGDLVGEGERAVEVAEPQVTGGEAGERDQLGVRGLGLPGQPAGPLVVRDGVGVSAQPAPD